MEPQQSVVQIVENAARLDVQEFESLFNKLAVLRAQRTAPFLPKEEADLLKKINEGFPAEKWSRLAQLDEKMELSDLLPVESDESLLLAEELEAYTVQRFVYLKELATLRKILVEQLMQDLDIAPKYA